MTTPDSGDSPDKKMSSDTLLKITIPAAVTLFLGVATFWIDHRVSVRAQQEQSSRLYTQLISQREQASSDLRKDMFKTILSGFLGEKKVNPPKSSSKDLDEDLFKLELLALNFGDSLSLGPIFTRMDRRIRAHDSYASADDEDHNRKKLHNRLTSLARRVGDGQRASLSSKSKSIRINVPLGEMGEKKSYAWPHSDSDEPFSCMVLDGVQRRVSLLFTNPQDEAETIDIQPSIFTYTLDPQAPVSCKTKFNKCDEDVGKTCGDYIIPEENKAASRPFTIDQFNLPLIDNSLLSHDQRFALIMRSYGLDNDDDNVKDKEVEIVAILFPGAYAGRRDKLTLDQAIEELKGRLQ